MPNDRESNEFKIFTLADLQQELSDIPKGNIAKVIIKDNFNPSYTIELPKDPYELSSIFDYKGVPSLSINPGEVFPEWSDGIDLQQHIASLERKLDRNAQRRSAFSIVPYKNEEAGFEVQMFANTYRPGFIYYEIRRSRPESFHPIENMVLDLSDPKEIELIEIIHSNFGRGYLYDQIIIHSSKIEENWKSEKQVDYLMEKVQLLSGHLENYPRLDRIV